ncbi:MAG: T9SS type A sorting domain-containing protein [Bacteroidota bacterium]
MKRNFGMLAVLLTVISTSLFAADKKDDNAKVGIVANTAIPVYNLVYEGESAGNVKVKIYDADGRIILTDFFKSEGKFVKPYNFKNLAAGNYTFEVTGADFELTEEVVFNANTVKKASNVQAKLVKSNNFKKFSLIVYGEEVAPVTVSIFNKDNELVFVKTVDMDDNFFQVYNLEQLRTDNVTVLVSTEGRSLTEEVFTF